jgi:hypothetical protein
MVFIHRLDVDLVGVVLDPVQQGVGQRVVGASKTGIPASVQELGAEDR